VRRAWRSGRVTCSSLRTTVFSHRPRSTRRDRQKGNPVGALPAKARYRARLKRERRPLRGGAGCCFRANRRAAKPGVLRELAFAQRKGVVEPGNLPELGRQPSSAFDQSFAAELVTRHFAAAATAGRCKA
jgi:hypothetical protein